MLSVLHLYGYMPACVRFLQASYVYIIAKPKEAEQKQAMIAADALDTGYGARACCLAVP